VGRASRSHGGIARSSRSWVVLGLAAISVTVIVGCEGSTPATGTSTSGGASNGGNASSNGGSANGGSSNGSTSSTWPGSDDAALESCAEYGIELSGDCSQCPATPLGCPCFEGTLIFPTEACTFGHCITAIDCDRACGNAGDPANPQSGDLANPDLGTDILAIQDCVEVLKQCNSGDDSDCGDGKCVFDAVRGQGQCSAGAQFDGCGEANDCQSGFCIRFTLSEVGHCDTGEPGAACETSAQCLAGSCLVYTPETLEGSVPAVEQGVCSSGLADEPCTADEQCAAPTHCVPEVPTRVLGWCSPGEVADLCDDASDCQSGFCFVWGDLDLQQTGFCTTGGFREPCIDESDCESGYCSRQIENTSGGGSCVPGDLFSPCFDDQDCESAHCALLVMSDDPQSPGPVAEGTCTTGASGDPCQDNADCTSANCVNPSKVFSATCTPAPPMSPLPVGSPCENDGVCDGFGFCFQGNCE
jgi:hypothetical protein